MENPELWKWVAGLKPGDISNYAILVIFIIGSIYALHKEHIVMGSRWRDKVTECSECKTALESAKSAIERAAQSDTEKLVELTRLRVEREHSWRTLPQSGQSQ